MGHVAERFWSKVDASAGPGECWPWTASVSTSGYGHFRADGRTWSAHRWLMSQLEGRRLDSSEFSCHRCDNRPCCNPAHLYIGSAQDNIRDRESRGRSGSGKVNAVKTHCPRGHAYEGHNVRMEKGSRICRACLNARARARRLKEVS